MTDLSQLERYLADPLRANVSPTPLLRWAVTEISYLRALVQRYREMERGRCACGRGR